MCSRNFLLMAYLNEVLSIRAQESAGRLHRQRDCRHLNEVLSIRAQEFYRPCLRTCEVAYLNEVLSIRAQECMTGLHRRIILLTSMKS